MKPVPTLRRFDQLLASRGLRLDAVVVGGSALALLGITSRQTRDCDILFPQLPDEIQEAARAFAAQERDREDFLADDWLNNGPESLARDLPEGWLERTHVVFRGDALTLSSLHRMDLLRSKLFALCDRGIDRQDCVALAPTAEELAEIRPWLEERDANPDWPTHVRATLDDLRGTLRHGV